MKSNSRWMQISIMFVVLSLTTTQLAPNAFGANREDNWNSETSGVEIPDHPVSPDTLVRALDSTAQATPQTQTAPAAARTNDPAAVPSSTPHKGKSRKWILIIAAVGAGIAAVFLLRNNDESPTITVGAPTVGQPQ
jgi:hypothetical protein